MRIIFSVTNDLVADRRVHRIICTVMQMGHQITLVGRRKPDSQALTTRTYKTRRLRLLFHRGPLFYAGFNLRLFLYLLFHKMDILVANDLDTLLANYLVSRLKNIPLIYDSHEFFTGLPELADRKRTRNIWLGIEKRILPGIKHAYTVSGSIANEYKKLYGIDMKVVRNLPLRERNEARHPDLLVCNPRPVIIYQGSLNIGRGLEKMIRAMHYMKDYELKIYGDGTIKAELMLLVKELDLQERVKFMGLIPFEQLRQHTRQASLGFSLEENLGLNYYYSLPNKLFDYIHAGIPVLVSDLPEMRRIVVEYGIGVVTSEQDPELLARTVEYMLTDQSKRMEWKKNLRRTADELCWENEEGIIREIYSAATISGGID